MRLLRTFVTWLLDDPYSLRSLPYVMVPELQLILDAERTASKR